MPLPSLGDDPRERDARTELLGMVIHELRSPLTVAMSHTELLIEAGDRFDAATAAEMLGEIVVSVEALAALLDDLAVVAGLGAGGRRLPADEIDLHAALVAGLGAAAADTELAAQLDAAPAVLADQASVSRILGELVANARRATGGGAEPLLSARRRGARVVVEVTDSGPAIPDGERRQALDRLSRRQARGSSTRVTGMGVTVARVLAEAMDGTLEIDDAAGGGCVFRLELPAAD